MALAVGFSLPVSLLERTIIRARKAAAPRLRRQLARSHRTQPGPCRRPTPTPSSEDKGAESADAIAAVLVW